MTRRERKRLLAVTRMIVQQLVTQEIMRMYDDALRRLEPIDREEVRQMAKAQAKAKAKAEPKKSRGSKKAAQKGKAAASA